VPNFARDGRNNFETLTILLQPFLKEWFCRGSRETRITKAYELDPAKLGCFEKRDINNLKV
jgi:hypothetical protein